MVRVSTNALNDKNVCTYMECLKMIKDKLNEVIDYLNEHARTFRYTINLFGSNFVVAFDLYSTREVDADTLDDFTENFDEDFELVCNGVINDNQALSVYYDHNDKMFTITDIESTDTDISLNQITNSYINIKEI